MSRKASVAIALCCTVVGVALAGCDEASEADPAPSTSATAATTSAATAESAFIGTKKITVDGRAVNVSCSGTPAAGQPVVVLLHGGGDALDKFAGIQQTLSGKNRVCSYDRLGAGASDQPDGPQTMDSTGKILTGVLDQLAGNAPVVLAGHSLGGLIAARYAPEHQDRVKGLVLMDATSPTQTADLQREIPASATGDAAELRDQTLAIFRGESPEKLVITDGDVASAGTIPVEVIEHGKQYLAAVPQYGEGLEQAWTAGQHKWLALSSRSRLSVAQNSEHYIYLDQPDIAVQAIERVAEEAVS
ncbi:alpha/beta hydrolase [Amycolatopsis acidicola]|uniref:Alpha/beta hydrolase n=1 Tax=Amycolatopsis acidicola TaxID=2596893 RepID=A0A5N0VL72_9PSEU|nr:alpha/beta hydrolase [Amycolatopsis acidicola]KAA9166084.1 alpha/beta hydrolase [Amycolatopsis acidicola]